MGDLLVKSNTPHEQIQEFFDLLKLCWSPNFCKFNGKFYEFPEEVGIPIGSPLGSLISEVFMSKFEHDLFASDQVLLNHILYWHRYVDDILVAWTGPQDLLNELLQWLNGQYPSIKFTLEIGGASIKFLDLAISERDGVHEFAIHRKETSTDTMIHGPSFGPVPHKLAAFNSYIHRLTHIPLSQTAFNEELNIIKHLAEVNQVDVDVDRMVRKKLTRKCLDSTTSLARDLGRDKKLRWIRLPYLGKFSSKLSRTLRLFGFRPAYYNLTTVKGLFVRLKDPVPAVESSGVYSIQCNDCNGIYVGETGRQIKIRVAEHLKTWRKGILGESAFADHLIANGHCYREGSATLLHKEKSYFKRLALENIEIIRYVNNDKFNVLNRYIPDGGL